MNNNRPVNLELSTLKFHPMAIASILHRISGIILFLAMPLILYLLATSLRSEEAFVHAKTLLTQPFWKLLVWGFCTALSYHLYAGIRHILMDIGFGEHLAAGRRSAVFVIALAVISTLILGYWIW